MKKRHELAITAHLRKGGLFESFPSMEVLLYSMTLSELIVLYFCTICILIDTPKDTKI